MQRRGREGGGDTLCCNVANALSYWQPKLKLAAAPANRQTHGNMAKAQVCRRQNYAVNKSFFFFIYILYLLPSHTHTQLSYKSICRLKLHALTAFYGFLTVAATVASSCCLLPAASCLLPMSGVKWRAEEEAVKKEAGTLMACQMIALPLPRSLPAIRIIIKI